MAVENVFMMDNWS